MSSTPTVCTGMSKTQIDPVVFYCSLTWKGQVKRLFAEMDLAEWNLKEHCHDDFAVLGQFCAKIITLRL